MNNMPTIPLLHEQPNTKDSSLTLPPSDSVYTFKPLTLEALEQFRLYYPLNHFELSDLSPISLWVWRDSYQVSWCIIEDFFCLRCQHANETYYLPPVGQNYDQFAKVIHILKEDAHAASHPLRFRAIPREMLNRMSMATNQSVSITEDRANWDYLYLTKDLIDLKGRKYQHIRNHINKFQNTYHYTYVPVTCHHLPQIETIFTSWAATHPDEPSVSDERQALYEAFASFESLKLMGGMICIGDQPVAFSIGSLLKDDTVQIHFQKALPEMNGAYALVSREFIAHAWSATTYVNWEDDLGLPGLREAKRRYHPVKMVEKYIVSWP